MKWLEYIDEARAEGFEGIERDEDLPGQALADSLYWARALFASGTSPYDTSARVRRAVHRATASAPDLVRHEYEAAGLHLVVTEGRSFALVVVSRADADVLGLSEGDQKSLSARIAAAILHPVGTKGGVCFRFPERIEEGSRFSTNPDADPRLLGVWSDRVDAGIREGALYFLLYKRLPWMMGFGDAFSWLRDDVRPFRRRRRRRRS
jgi:hypothetical protein